ncbi:hypothetical protein BDW62DRAFT_202174 [Aspergillus aurantiobrunneus]
MASPTLHEHLTPLDSSMPRTYIRAVLVFEQTGPATQIARRLQSGLDGLSKRLPWLSGTVFSKASPPEQPYSLEIRRDANTAPTLIDKRRINTSYETVSANGMPPASIPETVWPVPGMIDEALDTAGAPVFAASTFRFADRGLWAQSVAEPRSTFTSSSQNRCGRLAGALARDLHETSSISTDDLLKEHPEYSRIPPAFLETFPSCTSKLFTISLHWIDTLKSLLRKHTSTPPSTNTTLAALLWSTITRVRRTTSSRHSETKTSRLITAVNGRQRLSPAFSSSDPRTQNIGGRNCMYSKLTK